MAEIQKAARGLFQTQCCKQLRGGGAAFCLGVWHARSSGRGLWSLVAGAISRRLLEATAARRTRHTSGRDFSGRCLHGALAGHQPDRERWALAWTGVAERHWTQAHLLERSDSAGARDSYWNAWRIFQFARWPTENTPARQRAGKRALASFSNYAALLEPPGDRSSFRMQAGISSVT